MQERNCHMYYYITIFMSSQSPRLIYLRSPLCLSRDASLSIGCCLQKALGRLCAHASRARGPLAGRPLGRPGPKDKLESATAGKNVVPGEPALIPLFAVDFERLHLVRVLGAACRGHLQRLAPAQRDREIREPRRADEEGRLARHRVEPDHAPEQPRLHGAGVAIARQAVARRVVVRLGDEAAALDGEVLAADKVVQVRRSEARLVARVEERVPEGTVPREDARLKRLVQALDEGVVAGAEADERRQVVVRVERVLPGECLVVVVAPVAAAAGEGVLREEGTRGVARADEAGEAESRHVAVPVVAPVVGAVEVAVELGVLALAGGDGGEGEVVDGTVALVSDMVNNRGRSCMDGEPTIRPRGSRIARTWVLCSRT